MVRWACKRLLAMTAVFLWVAVPGLVAAQNTCLYLTAAPDGDSVNPGVGSNTDGVRGHASLLENDGIESRHWRVIAEISNIALDAGESEAFDHAIPADSHKGYCVRITTPDKGDLYSPFYIVSGGCFHQAEFKTDICSASIEERRPKRGYFRRHRAGIITFISLGSVVIFLFLLVLLR